MKIDKNKLILYKGQSHSVKIVPYVNGEAYVLKSEDRVTFSVRVCAGEGFPVICRKTLTTADYLGDKLCLSFSSAEIQNIPAGSYKYDCVLKTEGRSFIFIGPANLFVRNTAAESELLQ